MTSMSITHLVAIASSCKCVCAVLPTVLNVLLCGLDSTPHSVVFRTTRIVSTKTPASSTASSCNACLLYASALSKFHQPKAIYDRAAVCSCVLRILLPFEPAAGPRKHPAVCRPVCSTVHLLPPQPHSASAKRMKDKTPQRKTSAALSRTLMRAGARRHRQQPPQMSRWDTHTTGRGTGVHPHCCRVGQAWAPVPGAPASE